MTQSTAGVTRGIRLFGAGLTVACLAMASTSALAANKTWSSATTGAWEDSTRWSGGVVPGSSDTAVFDNTGVGRAIISLDPNVQGISVNSGYTGTVSVYVQTSGQQGLLGEYYDGTAFNTYLGAWLDTTINWPTNNFDSNVVGPRTGDVDHFSVRWSGQVYAPYTETYTFFTDSDDGARLWVNSTQVINDWTVHAYQQDTGSPTLNLTAGHWYDIRLEYFENTAISAVKLSYQSLSMGSKTVIPTANLRPQTAVGLTGAYYDGTNFDTFQNTYLDGNVDFSPADTVLGTNRANGNDTFSVRWTGQVYAAYSETYTFYTQSEQGAKLWVNGTSLVNNFTQHTTTENSGTIALTSGTWNDIKLEFFDNNSAASVIQLKYASPSEPKKIIPASKLRPSPVTIGSAGMTVAAGTLDAGGSITRVTGDVALSGGTLVAPGQRLEIAGTFNKTGGTFTHNSGSLLLKAGSSKTLTPGGSTFNNVYLNDGLIGYWPFDEGGGLWAIDQSGYGHTATLGNAPTWTTDVPSGLRRADSNSLQVDGSTQYLRIARTTVVEPAAVTMATWVKRNGAQGMNVVMFDKSWQNDASPTWASYLLQLNPQNAGSDVPRVCIGYSGNIDCAQGASGLVPDLTWTHLAATYDPAGASPQMRLYVNGVLVASTVRSDAILYDTTSLGDLFIGQDGNNNNFYNGWLDDMRLYNRALTGDEVSSLYRGGQRVLSVATHTLAGAMVANGDLVLDGATLDVSASNYGVTVGGSWLNNGGSFTPRSGTVTLNGTRTGKSILSGWIPFYNLTVAGSGGAWTLNDRLIVSNTLAISNGTLGVSTSNYQVHVGTMNQTGGTFTPQTGIVVVDATSAQTFTATSTLNNLRLTTPTETGLVGYWKMDDSQQWSSAADSSGSGLNATLTNSPAWSTSVPSGVVWDNPTSLKVDGTSYAEIARNATLEPAAVTVSFWAKPNGAQAAWSRPLVKGWNNDSGPTWGSYQFIVSPGTGDSTMIEWTIGHSAGTAGLTSATGGLPDATWTHVVGVYDPAGSAPQQRLYLNGTLVQSQTFTSALAYDTSATGFLRIGAYTGPGFNGWMDDVRIYNRGLTQTEVSALYAGRTAGGDPPETNLAGRWKFDETSGTTVVDSSTGGNNGTLTNGPILVKDTPGGASNLRSLQFNSGRSQYVAMASSLAGTLGGTATLAAWIKTSMTGNNTMTSAPGITGTDHVGDANDIFWGWIDASGYIGVQAGTGSAAKSSAAINDNTWHHITMTRDSTSGQVIMYVDGVQANSATSDTGTKSTAFSSIGRIENSANPYFNGFIDDVRMYSRVLTAPEVSSLYRGRRGVVMVLGGNLNVGGTLNLDGAGLSTASYSASVTGATGVNSGVLGVGSNTVTLTGGLTVQPQGVLEMLHTSGILALGSGTTFTMNGTLASNNSSISARPTIQAVSGNYTFSVGTTATLNVNGLAIRDTTLAGMDIASGATFTNFRGLRFSNIAGTTGQYLKITANGLYLKSPDCYFDTAGAGTKNVVLVDSNTGDTNYTKALFDFKDTATHGALGGDSYDGDDDNGTGGDVTANDGLPNPVGGSVIAWATKGATDTAGSVEGFPSAAFNWTTFTWYATYVAFKNIGGAASADRVFVRDANGANQYSYDIPETDGDIIGAPRWAVVSETSTWDINGNGTFSESNIKIVYVATTGGKIYKLIDSGSALAPPASGVWSTPFSTSTVTAINSPLVLDSSNIYFGGKSTSTPKIFGVQITDLSGTEKTLVKNIGTSNTGDVTAAPAWKVYNNSGNKTYLFLSSKAAASQAYLYRVDVPGGTVQASCCGSSISAHDMNGSVRLWGDHAIIGDSGARLHSVVTDNFNSNQFINGSGFPYRDTDGTRHPNGSGQLDAGNYAILSSPYVEAFANRIYYGDKDSHVYALTSAGALVSNFPLTLSPADQVSCSPMFRSGVLVIGTGPNAGTSGGRVYFIDESTGNIFKRYDFGPTTITGLARDAGTGRLMIATSGGDLYFVPFETDPT